jgi:hypothetical protein
MAGKTLSCKLKHQDSRQKQHQIADCGPQTVENSTEGGEGVGGEG